ncbi:MAG TPA: TlpA disulfide reductase family protein [Candidatus Limnocylindria bacterium]|jgi:thiol-disulfide isomerase/thioredoxin|nr:TlpA disulfide reductase family protein [Candidatus Limnocylindria bacterium]
MFRPRTLLLTVLASLALLGARHRPPATVFDLSDAVGKPVPNVALTATDGAPLALEQPDGRPTYVFLFASWCGPCQQELPFVRSAYAKYGDRVHFVGVDVLEEADAAQKAVAAANLPFPVAIYPIDALDAVISPDDQLAAGMKYRIPADFLIGADGVVRYAWHGLQINDAGAPVDVLPSYLAKLGLQ